MIIKTVEFEIDGKNIFATGLYNPEYNTVEDIEYDCEDIEEIDERTNDIIIHTAYNNILESVDVLDQLTY